MVDRNFILKDEYLEVKVSGDLNLENAKEGYAKLAKYCLTNNVHRILIDGSNVSGSMPPIDIYDLAREFDNLGMSRLDKIAIFAAKPPESEINISETMIRNRGFDLMFFPDRDPAEKWLLFEKNE